MNINYDKEKLSLDLVNKIVDKIIEILKSNNSNNSNKDDNYIKALIMEEDLYRVYILTIADNEITNNEIFKIANKIKELIYVKLSYDKDRLIID